MITACRFSPQAYQFGEGFFPLCCQLPALLLVNVMNIKTNNQPRRLLFACEFSGAERAKLRQQFDWMSDEEFDSDCSFFRYKGYYYNLADFMRVDVSAGSPFVGWHGYSSDSYFSGVLIKLCGEDVIVGRYYS